MIRRGWEREAAEKALFESVNNVLRWDYSELLRRFSIPWEEAFGLMMLRHEEMLDVYQDAVELIRRLKAAGAHLCIVSNNPYWGCRWKLLRAGLEPVWFEHIFSTDHTGGCKSLAYVWDFVIPRIGAPPERISTVGDDPKEDGVLPLSAGAGRAFILRREKDEMSFPDSRMIPVENALQIPDFFKEKE